MVVVRVLHYQGLGLFVGAFRGSGCPSGIGFSVVLNNVKSS